MKKILLGLITLVSVVVMLFSFTACNKYKWDAVGGTEYSDSVAENNGTVVVKQGSYLYYVNGVNTTALTAASENEWGGASVKGSIMKSKIEEDGSLKCLGVVVPKTFYSGYSNAGLYVYGDWIYYVTRTIRTDNKGTPIDGLEYMRSKTDGTKTQSIAIVESTSSSYIFTEKGLIYTNESNIYFVGYTDKKVEKEKVLVEEYTDVEISKEKQMVFFAKASDNELIQSNSISVILKDGTIKEIIKTNSFTDKEDEYYLDIANQFTVDVIKYDAKENVLYYTKKAANAEASVGTYGYKFKDENFAFDKANEKQYAKSALSTVYPLGFEKGLLDYSSTSLVVYKPMTGSDEIKSDTLTTSSTINIVKQEGSTIYYLLSNLLYKADILTQDGDAINTSAYAEKISTATFGSQYGAPVFLDNYVYFENSAETNYLYRMDLNSYSMTSEITYAKAYIVSGYKTHTYAEDDEFIINKDDESIKDKVPAYITEADLSTYIDNHKSAKD